ncbi:MAG TPA: hypothetical protein VLB51_04145 [Methylomirabilota bacterium]|nr:hypothetical protein [Methylomirabilota bacterium]
MAPTLDGGRVQVVTGALHYDDGYVVGELELDCDRLGGAAFRHLADTYDPRLDVFAVDETRTDGNGDSALRLQVRVQCAFEDAPRLWRLLEQRLRAEGSPAVVGAWPPSSVGDEPAKPHRRQPGCFEASTVCDRRHRDRPTPSEQRRRTG